MAAAQNSGMAGNRVALALGSGGARGYAHIGVIDELRDRGYDIVGIAGSSMGALVGGLQAADRLDEFADWAKSLTQRAVLRLLDPSITAAGVLRAEKILDAVRDILGEVTIEELPIPYTAVSTDLLVGQIRLAATRSGRRGDPGVDRDSRRDHTARIRRAPARRRRHPRPAADGADRRGQRRPHHRGQPRGQRGRRPLRADGFRAEGHDGMAEPNVAQHHRVVRVATAPSRRPTRQPAPTNSSNARKGRQWCPGWAASR